jgi:hypothetical protein
MTKDERAHYGKLSQMGCIACIVLGHGYSPSEIHHIRTGTGAGLRSHWSKAIPLCPLHHRGGHGTGIHGGIKAFEKMVGMSEVDLLKKTLNLLEGRI